MISTNFPVLFQGKIDKPGTVGVTVGANTQAATMTQDPNSPSNGKQFAATVSLPVGANTVTVTATNLNGDTVSSNYTVTVTGGPRITFSYDADGNLTNRTRATAPITTNEYDWDAENRLVELTQWTNGVKFSSLLT